LCETFLTYGQLEDADATLAAPESFSAEFNI